MDKNKQKKRKGSSVQDLIGLKNAGLPAAIVGKAYYEGRITLEQLSQLSQE